MQNSLVWESSGETSVWLQSLGYIWEGDVSSFQPPPVELKHISLQAVRGKKRERDLKKQVSPKLPIPIPLHLRTRFLMHSLLHSKLLLLTSQRHSTSENHTCLGYLLVSCLVKCPWHKHHPPKAEKGTEHLLQRFHPSFVKMRWTKICHFWKVRYFGPEFRALWVQQG